MQSLDLDVLQRFGRTSAQRRNRLADFNLSPQQIARLRGPVGLAIGARAPPEIALAILADLVALRNGIVLERIAAGTERRRACPENHEESP